MGTSRSAACGPALGVDRNPDAARVHDDTTSMERLELVEQGLSKPRAQPWLTVAVVRFVHSFCGMLRASAHQQKQSGPEWAC